MQELDLFGNPIEVPESKSVQFDPTQFGAIETEIEDDFIPALTKLEPPTEPLHNSIDWNGSEKVIVLNGPETHFEIVEMKTEPVAEEPSQPALFEKGEWWEEHWKGMPEFKQEDFMPWHTVYVHFENRADMEKFAKLVGQNIMLTTKSIWYPEAELAEVNKLRWIAKPEAKNTKKEELKEILDSE